MIQAIPAILRSARRRSLSTRSIRRLALALSALLAGSAVAQSTDQEMFPFVIPGLDTPEPGSVVDVSWLNDKPAGKDGFVRVRDSHFVDARGKRIRFLASNFTFGSCFPEHAMADKLAARLASLGINCIRFHHMDNGAAPRGLWKAGTSKKNELDPGQLDKLDYFIAALKRNGIYADINLHVSRDYWEGEDFPDGLSSNREREEKLPNYGKGLDKINEQMIRMQRDYARALLTHVNPYTGNAYAKEPGVAIVEINNENTLLDLKVSTLPEYYRSDITKKWNAWLKSRYSSSEKVTAAWGTREELGPNLLPVKIETQGGQYVSVSNTPPGEIRVSVLQIPEVSWHAQLHWLKVPLEEGRLYTLEFTAGSDKPRKLPVSTRFSIADWHNCGLSEDADVNQSWKTFTYTFRATRTAPESVRLDMVVGGGPVGDFWIKDMTLRRGGSLGLKPGESLEAGNIGAPERTEGIAKGADWTRFLSETERAYTDGMRTFLKKDLGVQAAIIDTQASYGDMAGIYRESFNDFIDMHAYWQHPHFPGRPWDGANWLIQNTPMVADKSGGNLARLGVYRVADKPFTVSEYDHPAPSHYVAEMFPMISSFAAVQDWDGLFQFDWGGTTSDSGKISGYFSLQQHPGKLAFLPSAALMFRRGDVAPANATARLNIPVSQIDQLTSDKVSVLGQWRKSGLTLSNMLSQRLELRLVREDSFSAQISKPGSSALTWDTNAGIYTVDTEAAAAVVGRCTGKTMKLKNMEFTVGSNPLNFAVLTVNSFDGKPTAKSNRLLLTAAGNVENTGMGWNAEHTTVGTRWGSAPTICEGIAAKVTLRTAAKKAKVYALDGKGKRGETVPVKINEGQISFEIGPRFKTLWYEIVQE